MARDTGSDRGDGMTPIPDDTMTPSPFGGRVGKGKRGMKKRGKGRRGRKARGRY